MASNINPYNIDGTFPVANQDNPSQGFRDNFTNIKNNFTYAESEISDLQAKAVVTSALTGQTVNNDMAGTQIFRPQLASWTQSLLDLGAITGDVILNFNLANFQKVVTAGPISLNFVNWPASYGAGSLGYGLMRVWIGVSSVGHTLTFPESVTIGEEGLAGYDKDTRTITFDTPGNFVFDFSSIDGGLNYLVFDNTRNRIQFRDPSFYFNAEVNPTLLIGYNNATVQTAIALEQGSDTVSVFGSYNSVSTGLNYTGNIFYTQGDNGPTAGYSVTGLRGDFATGAINSVQNNDFIGYVNALSFTGDGAGANVVTCLGSIGFYARGTNPDNGLGGNVTIWTTPDGTGSAPFVAQKQAVGIENDQSVQLFGNLITSNVYVPTTSTSSGETGQISFDNNNIYICLGPNNWKKASLTSF